MYYSNFISKLFKKKSTLSKNIHNWKHDLKQFASSVKAFGKLAKIEVNRCAAASLPFWSKDEWRRFKVRKISIYLYLSFLTFNRTHKVIFLCVVIILLLG